MVHAGRVLDDGVRQRIGQLARGERHEGAAAELQSDRTAYDNRASHDAVGQPEADRRAEVEDAKRETALAGEHRPQEHVPQGDRGVDPERDVTSGVPSDNLVGGVVRRQIGRAGDPSAGPVDAVSALQGRLGRKGSNGRAVGVGEGLGIDVHPGHDAHPRLAVRPEVQVVAPDANVGAKLVGHRPESSASGPVA